MPFKVIPIRELPTWVKVFKEDNLTPEQLLQELTLIDDLLVLQKSKSLLSRKKNLKSILGARIGHELGHSTQNLNKK